ncbi:hypothetical protein C8J56DRAFT_1046300 [Mycena floridula]|nr:hypothetical protein C8J56DRAFT_1046300 [Mycena floridula]
MDIHQAVIYGSMGRMIMRMGFHVRENLNFAIGRVHASAFASQLSAILQVSFVEVPVNSARVLHMSKYMSCTLKNGRKVTIGVSQDNSFFPTVFCAGSSSQMDFVMSNHLVSPYPQMSMHGISLMAIPREWHNEQQNIYDRQTETKLICLDDNRGWTGPCKFNCPALDRDVKGLKGFGFMQWGNNGSMPWENTEDHWRLSKACDSVDCEHRDSDDTTGMSPGFPSPGGWGSGSRNGVWGWGNLINH